MRTLFSLIGFLAFAFIMTFTEFVEGKFPNHQQVLSKVEKQAVIQKIKVVNDVVKVELQLEKSQYQCDTCLSNMVDAIDLKRRLTDSLTVQNSLLYEKFVESIALNQSLDSVNKIVERQILVSSRKISK